MATVTYYNQTYTGPSSPFATVTSSPSLISLSFTETGITDNYFGNFVLSETSVIGGTLTQFSETYRGLLSFMVTGLQVPAATMATAVQTFDGATMLNLIFGGADTILGSAFGEPIFAGRGNDTVIALGGDDSIIGFDGNDDINGNQGQDIVLGGAGADTVRGGQGADTIRGDDGDDPHVNGNLGDDEVSGENGNDTVYGGQGNDTVFGDAGNDLISGDLGSDILVGGTGADWFVMRAGGGIDVVTDFNAADGDRIVLAPGTNYAITSSPEALVIALGGGDAIGLMGISQASFSASWIVFG